TAELALTRAEKAENDAKARASELEQVAKFQEAQLAGINAKAMGIQLRSNLLKKARAGAQRAKLSPDEEDARVGALDKLIAGSDCTGLALDALDQTFFQPALAAIEKQFATQPLVQARLLQAVATTMRQLGLLDAATRPLTQALEIRRRQSGP